MSQEQTSSTRLQQELKETSVRELVAIEKIDMHEAKMISLTKEGNSKDELYVCSLCLLGDDVDFRTRLHQLNVKLVVCEVFL